LARLRKLRTRYPGLEERHLRGISSGWRARPPNETRAGFALTPTGECSFSATPAQRLTFERPEGAFDSAGTAGRVQIKNSGATPRY
jgi:hypothetical protein